MVGGVFGVVGKADVDVEVAAVSSRPREGSVVITAVGMKVGVEANEGP